MVDEPYGRRDRLVSLSLRLQSHHINDDDALDPDPTRMTVELTGHDLTREAVVRVARDGVEVALTASAVEQMAAAREVVERSLARGDRVYGLSSGVGVLKRVAVGPTSAAVYSHRLIEDHRVGQGPFAAEDVVRAMMLRVANAFAEGSPGVRPLLAERLVDALNSRQHPMIHTLGSVGQADLAQMADLSAALFDTVELAAGEGLALVTGNAYSTAAAALAVTDATNLLDAMETAGALSLEAIDANVGMLHPRIAETRPFPGLQESLRRIRALLVGSFLLDETRARGLQDPLSFRNLPHVQGTCRDVLEHVERQLGIELNASQGNPIVVPADDRLVSVANFEILPLAAALDYLRVGLASALSTASERVVKLLETAWSGLPTGLAAQAPERVEAAQVEPASAPASPEAGLSYLGIAVQSLAGEARLLAQPVSFELASTAHAEGIEDRTTLAPLAARRVAEMVDLGRRIVAIELTVAAQAVELRGVTSLGSGTAAALARVRECVPFRRIGDRMPDLEPLVALVVGGAFASDPPGQ
jgi:histidine ammonia-lyase